MNHAPRRPLRGFSEGAQHLDYPIYLSGEPAGTLSERREGLYTVLTAHCPLQPGLHRLWLFGRSGRCYLGTLTPSGGELTLSRRLSRRARTALPAELRYAADRPMERLNTVPEPAAIPQPPAKEPVQQKAPQTQEAESLSWNERPGGALVAHDGGIELLALPVRPSPAMREKIRVINGREYLVFRRRG